LIIEAQQEISIGPKNFKKTALLRRYSIPESLTARLTQIQLASNTPMLNGNKFGFNMVGSACPNSCTLLSGLETIVMSLFS
jgi:hypothetical protein